LCEIVAKRGYLLRTVEVFKLIVVLLQWTTDQDLTDALAAIGVTDLLEIKFYENRANGQSKG